MSRELTVTLCLMSAAVVLAAATAPTLPPGPMQQKATTACGECHDTGILVQQRLDKNAWTKEVDKMIKWGAVVAPEDRLPLIDYFAANFGADKPPLAGSPYAANDNGKSAKANSKMRKPPAPQR